MNTECRETQELSNKLTQSNNKHKRILGREVSESSQSFRRKYLKLRRGFQIKGMNKQTQFQATIQEHSDFMNIQLWKNYQTQ